MQIAILMFTQSFIVNTDSSKKGWTEVQYEILCYQQNVCVIRFVQVDSQRAPPPSVTLNYGFYHSVKTKTLNQEERFQWYKRVV